MTLTSLIRDRQSWVWEWINKSSSEEKLRRFVTKVNSYIPKPVNPPDGIEPMFSGMGFTYAFRVWIDPKCLRSTTACRHATEESHKVLINALIQNLENIRPQKDEISFPGDYAVLVAKTACILARLDGIARGFSVKGEGAFTIEKTNELIADPAIGEISHASVEDIARLFMTIDDAWSRTSMVATRETLFSNPTFSLSYVCGGADAQMILGDTLIDIKTSRKYQPLTVDTFVQQLMYFFLDIDDAHKIRSIAWYFSRHKTIFKTPIEKLITNPFEKRRDFHEWVRKNVTQEIERNYEHELSWSQFVHARNRHRSHDWEPGINWADNESFGT